MRDMFKLVLPSIPDECRRGIKFFDDQPAELLDLHNTIDAMDVYAHTTQVMTLANAVVITASRNSFVSSVEKKSVVAQAVDTHFVKRVQEVLESVARTRARLQHMTFEETNKDEDGNDQTNHVMLLAHLDSSLQNFQEKFLLRFFAHISATLAERLKAIQKKTAAMSPNWNFFITDSHYNKTLSKKQLLTADVAMLPAQLTAHSDFIASFSEAFKLWKIPPPKQHDALKTVLAESHDIMEYAESTIAVSTAVKVVEEAPPSRRAALAAKIVEAGFVKDFPCSLKKLIMAAKADK